uniref:Apple domain-containing protein n=1 Tax=Clastoptera arizonana TaxID=38151 RepID=A0A1B6CQM5_9HEMI
MHFGLKFYIVWIYSTLVADAGEPSGIIVIEESTVCFRLFVTGRRVDERYIRKFLVCETRSQCEVACLQQVEFYCQGFNFRYSAGKQWGSSCELTSVSPQHLDLTADFNSDTSYDFFERDNSRSNCLPPSSNSRHWSPHGPQYEDKNKRIGAGGSYSSSYGGGGGFNGNYYGGGQGFSLQLPSDECFVRAKTGFRLDRSIVLLFISVPSLQHCESLCANEKKFVCNIFSFRYSNAPNQPRENCMLVELPYNHLNHYNQLIPDRDYDIYIKNPYGHPQCQPPKSFYISECFERVRSGLRLDNILSKLVLLADSLGDCERACINSKLFTCRAFSFQYNPHDSINQEPTNCHLTDWPLSEIKTMKHLIEDEGCELYLRGSYGHGCEFDRFHNRPQLSIPFHSNIIPHDDHATYPKRPIAPETPSYYFSKYYPPNNSPNYIEPFGYGPSRKPPQKVDFFPYFKNQRPPDGPIFVSGKLPPQGFGGSGSEGYLPPSSLGVTNNINPLQKPNFCYIVYTSPARLVPSSIRNSLIVFNEADCKAACTKARETSLFRCASLSFKGDICELSAIELRDLQPGLDFVHETDSWLFSWDFTDARCYTPPSGFIPPPSDVHSIIGGASYDWTWERFTVSGRPCKAGTFCTQNLDVGIWSCPVDDGDWDYCCRSGHQCGYSEGYNYPWCYVGAADRDQWRPCSDHYYPYQHTSRPFHWPVAYLHNEGPPNVTVNQQTSLVDNFLELLQNENLKKIQSQTTIPANSSTVEFTGVDITTETSTSAQTESTNAINKLWSWGQSKYNSTTSTKKLSNETVNQQEKKD